MGQDLLQKLAVSNPSNLCIYSRSNLTEQVHSIITIESIPDT